MSIRLTQSNFQAEVLDSAEPILVDFWASWCGPCKMLAPVIEELEAEDPTLRVGKVDVDRCPDLAMQYGVEAIPTLLYFKDGKVVSKSMGLQPKAKLQEMLK